MKRRAAKCSRAAEAARGRSTSVLRIPDQGEDVAVGLSGGPAGRCASSSTAGTIRTLALRAQVKILANDHKVNSHALDFRITLGATEIGAAWRKIKQGTEKSYLRVRLDDPTWPQPVWGVLLEATDDGRWC